MSTDLVAILVCPSCKGELELIKFPNAGTGVEHGEAHSPDSEVSPGLLKCKCSAVYPLIDGVPRLFEGAITSFPDFVSQHQAQIKACCGNKIVADTPSPMNDEKDDYASIRKSFSQEWSVFDYEHDKTWGWPLAERKKVFLGDIQMQTNELPGKRLLDAGCGNGTLSAALTDFGLDIVGLDLNDGLGLAYRNRSKYGSSAAERVRYVQGNLVQPPFREGAYDIVYSSGVIHHTPSSKHSFASLARMPRKGGRLYVWVYSKRALPVRLFFAGGRCLKQFISLQSLMQFCRALAPVYKLGAGVLDGVQVARFRPRTAREITLDLFDAFAPRFNHWHTEAEVRSWFEEYGFKNIHVSGIQKHGFGMYGDRI